MTTGGSYLPTGFDRVAPNNTGKVEGLIYLSQGFLLTFSLAKKGSSVNPLTPPKQNGRGRVQ